MNKITKKRYVLWGMGILFCLVFCYPLFSNTLVRGHDTYFHLARIEALKEAYIHGDFFPRLYYEQNFNFVLLGYFFDHSSFNPALRSSDRNHV